ncbi:hypothetical protein GIB67_035158 [Kingdonia uniflora]|uniref:DUF642 domain-containing protein n=1 Tax=Kingdonia uniflora TaxID=39325 RepID=A0A7J7LDH0_9MAGN|nr:hypothetical protein GIB67_035158 [Kingdonia uniflora]
MEVLLCLMLVFSPLFIGHTSAALNGLLPNGNFEQGPKPSNLVKTVIKGKYSLPKWKIDGVVEYIKGGLQLGVRWSDSNTDGVHSVKLGSGASVSQNITLKPGSIYFLTFAVMKTCLQKNEVLWVVVPSQPLVLPLQNLYSNISSGGDVYAWGFRAAAKVGTVTFYNPEVQKNGACGIQVDSIAIKEASVPLTTRGYAVPFGLGAVELISGNEGTISQILRTIPNKFYNLTFTVGDASDFCYGTLTVEVSVGKETWKVPYEAFGNGGSKTVTFKFKAIFSRTTIKFVSGSYQRNFEHVDLPCGPVVDQVIVTPLPLLLGIVYAKNEFSYPGDLIQLLLAAEHDNTSVFGKNKRFSPRRMKPAARKILFHDRDNHERGSGSGMVTEGRNQGLLGPQKHNRFKKVGQPQTPKKIKKPDFKSPCLRCGAAGYWVRGCKASWVPRVKV